MWNTFLTAAPPNAPGQQGVPFEPINPALKGRLPIFDSYVIWQTRPKLTLGLHADWVIETRESEFIARRGRRRPAPNI